MSTTGRPSLYIGSHAPYTTHWPSLTTSSHTLLRTYRPSLGIVTYTMWAEPAADEAWTIYNTSTEFCHPNPHVSTAGQLCLDIGRHAPYTTHRPTLATSSHTLLRTYQSSLGIVTYNAWPGPVAYEPWTTYITSTEFCYHNPHVSTTSQLSLDIGRHASYTTHQPGLATSSHTM